MHFSQRYTFDYVGIALTVIALAAVIAFGLTQQAQYGSRSRGSISNSGPQGGQALSSRLSQLGYQIRIADGPALAMQGNDRLLFVLASERSFTDEELATVDAWVRSGGSVLVAQEANRPQNPATALGVGVGRLWPSVRYAGLRLPVLNWPLVGEAEVRASRRLRVSCQQAVVHIGDCDDPILVSFGRGEGQVYVISAVHPFTNEGLQDRGNRQLLQNLVAANAPPGSVVVFDEVHHGRPSFWLTSTPEGWALIFSAAVIIAYFLLNNRRFGESRPSSRPTTAEQRETGKFITAMADAQQQLGWQRDIRLHYWQRLKRTLAQRYALDPGLPDQTFLAALTLYQSQEQINDLVYLMTRLHHHEADKVELQHWVERVIRKLEHT